MQVSLSRGPPRLRLSVMIKAMDHVMFDTGRLNQATTPSMLFVMTRTSRTVPSWPTFSLLPVTSSLRRSDQSLVEFQTFSYMFEF